MTPRQFEALLRVRRHRRDQIRVVLARILAESREIEVAARRAGMEREASLASLRSGTAGGVVDIDQAAGLRYHAGQLAMELARLTHTAAEKLERARKARTVLAKADAQVKVVERLFADFQERRRREAERRQDREMTDRFVAARGAGPVDSSDA
jgi:flagellar export protein FliJ